MSNFAIIFVAVIIGCLLLKQPLFIGFLVLLLCLLLFPNKDESRKERVLHIYQKAAAFKELYVVIFLIGMNISAWVIAGILPTMMELAFGVINPSFFLPIAFLLMAVASIVMGTGVGTLCSFGMVLLTVGDVMGIPTPLLLGALVSGAFYADRISPISALVQLTLKEYGVSYRSFLKGSLAGIILTTLICLMLYGYLGMTTSMTSVDTSAFVSDLGDMYKLSPYLLVIPMAMLLSAIIGVKSSLSLGVSVVISSVITVVYQGDSLINVAKQLLLGVDGRHLPYLQIGGAFGMLEVIVMVSIALGCASYLFTDRLSVFISKWTKTEKSELVALSVLSVSVNAITCDQTLGIVMPKPFVKHKPLDAAIAVSSSGTVMAPLMPWNVNSVIISSIMGYTAWDYFAYSYMNWLLPVVTLLMMVYKKNRKSDKL